MEEKRGPGRPKEPNAKRGIIMVRLSEEERASMERVAEASGRRLSEWLRELGVKAAQRFEKKSR
jgi:hypothetical protein